MFFPFFSHVSQRLLYGVEYDHLLLPVLLLLLHALDAELGQLVVRDDDGHKARISSRPRYSPRFFGHQLHHFAKRKVQPAIVDDAVNRWSQVGGKVIDL